MWAGRLIRRAPGITIFLAVLVVSLFFLAFPTVDLWFSGLFYTPDQGFRAKGDPLFIRLRELGPFLVKLVAIACLLLLLLKLFVPRRPSLVDLRWPLYLLWTLILGPGLVVNGLFKNNWGRPRPLTVEQFGGNFPYVPVWEITDFCQRNCSFVSGEASASIWFLSLAFAVPLLWRKPAVIAILVLVFAMSLNRIAFGGHFLSDTLLSWGITLLVMRVSYWIFFVRPPWFLTKDALEAAFSDAGLRIGGLVDRLASALARDLKAFWAKFSG